MIDMKRVRWGFAVFGALMMLLSGVADGALLLPVSGDKLGAGGHLRMHRSVAVDSAAPDSALWVTSGGETRVHSLRINGALLTKTPTEIDKLSSVVAVDASAPNGSISVSSSGVVTVHSDINLTKEALFYGLQGSYKDLMLSTTGLSDVVTVTADAVVLKTSDYRFYLAKNIVLSLRTTTSGLGGLDNGSIAYSGWYYVYVISNGVAVNGLLSASSANPVLPTGYTYFARVGAIRTQDANNYYPLRINQTGRVVEYVPTTGSNVTSWPAFFLGGVGTFFSAWGTCSLSGMIPPTARMVSVLFGSTSSSNGAVYISPYNGPITFNAAYYSSWGMRYYESVRMAVINQNLYVCSQSATAGYVIGWEDSF